MQIHYLAPKLTKRSLSNFSTDFKDSIEPEICNIINNFNINNMTTWKTGIKSHLCGKYGRWCVNSCRSVIFSTAESTNRWICRETVELKLNKLFLLLNNGRVEFNHHVACVIKLAMVITNRLYVYMSLSLLNELIYIAQNSDDQSWQGDWLERCKFM